MKWESIEMRKHDWFFYTFRCVTNVVIFYVLSKMCKNNKQAATIIEIGCMHLALHPASSELWDKACGMYGFVWPFLILVAASLRPVYSLAKKQ